MIKASSVLVATALLIACGCAPAKRPSTAGASARATIEEAFQAEVPSSATNLHVWSESLMTLCVYGRFDCSAADLAEFLAASALLPDKLEGGTNPLADVQMADLPWWQPASLQRAGGVSCDWDAGPDVASCMLAAGRNDNGDGMIVYFLIVYENKNQTGLRPAVKADPNWKQETSGISSKPPATTP